MKQTARRVVYRTLRATGVLEIKRRIRIRKGAGSAAILVFHSVRATPPEDGTTITAARFRSILGILGDRYHLLSVTELVSRLETDQPFTGKEVAITFDDGYLDNYEHAAPLLAEFRVPACFFVTTGYVGTSRQFWWDEQKGIRSELMTWEQVRELHRAGFEIGCHTHSHPDLGTEPITSWKRELLEPRLELENRLGAAVHHFAYPYGARNNISPEWVDAVERAGFRSNFSATNDHVTRTTDPYLIPRIGAAPQRSLEELLIDVDDAW